MHYVKFIVKRFIGMIPVILIVSFLVFFILRLSNVNPVTVMIGDRQSTEELRQKLTKQFNLDKPLLTQYFIWMKGIFTGNLGVDYVNGQDIVSLVASRIPVTLGLVVMSSVIGMAAAVLLGTFAALYRGKAADSIITVTMLIFSSIPSFLLSILVIIVITEVAPGYSFSGGFSNIRECFVRLIVPSLIMALHMIAMLGRVTRSSMISQLQAPYINTANAKGISSSNVTFKHAFHNAVIPVLTIAGLMFANSIGGTVLIEQIFSLPGVGGLLVTAIQQYNYPVVQILVLFMLAIYLTMSLIVDLLYAVIDPRVKLK